MNNQSSKVQLAAQDTHLIIAVLPGIPTMLRSLYAYKGTHARTLGFQAGERFVEVGSSRDANWLHVMSERGAVGYVPKNYVASDEVRHGGCAGLLLKY